MLLSFDSVVPLLVALHFLPYPLLRHWSLLLCVTPPSLHPSCFRLVGWFNPVWFDDTKMERFLWTDVVLTLKDELVSKKTQPLELNDESSYAGRVIGGIDGYTYPMLDKLVSENKAHRVNFNNDLEGLRRLNESDDLDALIVNEGPLKFYSDLLGLKKNLYISKQPSGVYPVRILLTNDL